ncbi:MAG: hypothetical protein ACQKBV_09875 [Puniceicoccales bacterium]
MRSEIQCAKGFTRVPNAILGDGGLSLQAKALYAIIASKPPQWEFSGRRLATESSNGFDALNRAIHELEHSGYLRRLRLPTGKVHWKLHDPDSENLNQVEPDSEKPQLGKPPVGKTRTISNTEKKVILISNTPKSENPNRAAEEIYERYPRKVGKAAALKAIEKRLKDTAHGKLLAAVEEYAAAVETWPQDDRQFIPHPATWFNQQRDDDDRSEWRRAAAPKTEERSLASLYGIIEP